MRVGVFWGIILESFGKKSKNALFGKKSDQFTSVHSLSYCVTVQSSVTWLAHVTLSACPSLDMKKALADSTPNPQLQAYCLMIITEEHKVDNFFTVRN